MFSVVAHGSSAQASSIGRAALAACAPLDASFSKLYTDLVFAHLSTTARQTLEDEMDIKNYVYQSDFARKYIALGKTEGRQEGLREGLQEGAVEGKVEALLLVLSARDLHATESQQARLRELPVSTIDTLLGAAVTTPSVDELLAAHDPTQDPT